MSTPFQLLGQIKSAAIPYGCYGTGLGTEQPRSAFRYNPYTPQQQAPAAPAAPTATKAPSWFQKNVVDSPWISAATMGLSFIPGGNYIGAGIDVLRGAYHTAQGNAGKAAEAYGMAGLGLIPGAAAAGKFGVGAARLAKGFEGMGTMARVGAHVGLGTALAGATSALPNATVDAAQPAASALPNTTVGMLAGNLANTPGISFQQ